MRPSLTFQFKLTYRRNSVLVSKCLAERVARFGPVLLNASHSLDDPPENRWSEFRALNVIDFQELLVSARGLASASSKLLVVVGAPASGKSRLLRRMSGETGWPIVNAGNAISQRLLALTKRQRRIKAEEIVADVLDATGNQRVCIDNTEILFDPSLFVNPITLFTNLSRNRLLVTTWNGRSENGSLIYAEPEHPEYYKGPAHGFPVVTLIDEKMRLFLQP